MLDFILKPNLLLLATARDGRWRPDNTKTPNVVEVVSIGIETPSTPAIPRTVRPVTTTEQSITIASPTFPSTSVDRRSLVTIMPNILTPFRDIAVHIV